MESMALDISVYILSFPVSRRTAYVMWSVSVALDMPETDH